jgi:lipoprotein-anchoring transpeptidase ErfK/SrfK
MLGERGQPTRATALRGVAVLVLAGALALSAGCTGRGDAPVWQGGSGGGNSQGGGPAGQEEQQQGPRLSATVTDPAADATNVPASTYVTFKTELAKSATLHLKDESGKPVKGVLAHDGKTWQPSAALDYGTRYTAEVTVTGDDGRTATTTSNFTTMKRPAKQVRVSTRLSDNAVVGVAMPLIVNFGRPIPPKLRDDVERRMVVKSNPPQTGAWHWFSGTEVYYRPKAFWKAGTRLSYRLATGGLPMGDSWFGRSDITVVAKVGSAVTMTVDNRSKRMTVRRNGKVLRTIPVSLGKPKTPSSSGTMVIMEKLRKTVFDTFEELGPKEGYRVDIEYAQRLTYGGEFVHAAPWSEKDQGRRNVSHGCVNVSQRNAAWLFGVTKVGDPVTVRGTETRLSRGNGWTIWNMSWKEYAAGSALR